MATENLQELAGANAVAGFPEAARDIARRNLALAHTFGKPAHVRRLQIITELADDPEAMEQKIREQGAE